MRFVRITSPALVIALAGMPALAAAQAPAPAPAASAPAAETPATPADITPVAGDWTLTGQSPMGGTATFQLSLRVDSGKVAADITSEMTPKTAIPEIVKSGSMLILRYAIDYQGQSVPVVLTVTPKGDQVAASFDFANGAAQMDAVGTKPQK